MTQTLTLNRKKNNIVHKFYLTTKKYKKIYSFTFPIKYSLILLYVPLSKQTNIPEFIITHTYLLTSIQRKREKNKSSYIYFINKN